MQCVRVAAVLMLLALLAPACSNDEAHEGTRPPAPPPPAGLHRSCPASDTPVRYAEGDLREGAQSVKLCPGPPIVTYDGTILGVGIQSPEVLTTRVDDLVDAVNALKSFPSETLCLMDAGPRLTYWFMYPDGDARAVTFENFGCENLIVGPDTQRAEGNRVAQLFTEALLSQRAATSPPQAPTKAPGCRGLLSQPGTTLPSAPVELVSASLCVEAGPSRVREAEVPAAMLDRLDRGLLAEEMRGDGCTRPPRRPAVLIGYNSWGDLLRYFIDACGRVSVPRTPGWLRREEQAFRLSPELGALLDALPLGPVTLVTSPTMQTLPPETPG